MELQIIDLDNSTSWSVYVWVTVTPEPSTIVGVPRETENAASWVSSAHSPLYKITTLKLEETKRYLIDNLYKGFIKPSQSPFALPILFIKFANSSLRFYIDYSKLNELTYKD
jgi:hypothetical protein